jgi:hypothetical protein
MNKFLFLSFFLIASVSSAQFANVGNYNKKNISYSTTIAAKQSQFDAIAATADFFLSAIPTGSGQGGAFKNTGLTISASSDGDPVLGLKGFGNNPPTITTLIQTGTTYARTEPIYHNNKGGTGILSSIFVDRGNFDKSLQFFNSALNMGYLETNPGGSVTPFNFPIDIIFALRHEPAVYDESAHGLFKNESVSGGRISIFGKVSTAWYSPYEDQVIRFTSDISGNWQIWKNGVSIGTGTGATAPGLTEYFLGTNSHVDNHKLRYLAYKFGGTFSAGQLSTIYTNSQALWPWGVPPSYPCIQNLYQATSAIVSGGNFEFGATLSTTFSGGNGTAGTHQYRWFYADISDATLFPGGDSRFRVNRQVPATITLTGMTTGNSISAITMDGVPVISSTINFTTDIATTNTAIATAINAGPQSTKFMGYVRNGVVQVHILDNNWRADVLAVTASGFTPSLIQTPRTKQMSRTTYSTTGQVYDGSKLTNSTVWLMCIVTPFDSSGARGEDIRTNWYLSNF